MTVSEHHLKLSLETAGIVLVSALALPTLTDPDLWGHLRFGLDIIAARQVPLADTYSFTSDRPWINHEWLSEVLMAASYSAFGTVGLIGLKFVLLAGFVATTWLALWLRGVGALWRFIAVAFVILASLALLHSIRPQLWSLLCTSTLLAMLSARRRSWLIATPFLFAVWVNSHGGWMIGLLVLVVWLAEECHAGAISGRVATLTVAACASATLANPYGYKLLMFIGETVRTTRDDVTEWLPVIESKPYLVIWVGSVVLLARAAAGRRAFHLIASLALAYLSWRVLRVTPFFALVTVVAALPWHKERIRPMVRTIPFRGRDRTIAAAMCAIVLAAAAVTWSVAAATSLSCIRILPDGPDQVAAAAIKRLELRGRMITWFDWGEYAIWQFGPTLQVSMDGRRETVYGPDTLQRHRSFIRAGFDGWPELETLRPDYIWLPRTLPAANFVVQRGWRPIISTQRSIVWTRDVNIVPATADSSQPERCFPGLAEPRSDQRADGSVAGRARGHTIIGN